MFEAGGHTRIVLTHAAAEIIVREASAADREGIWRLTQAFTTSFVPSHEAFNVSLAGILVDFEALLLVAVDGSAIVGYLSAHRHATLFANGPVAWVEELMVDQPTRGAGVGRQLMDRAECWARDGGARYLALATRRAGGFYQALGYEDSAVFFRKMV